MGIGHYCLVVVSLIRVLFVFVTQQFDLQYIQASGIDHTHYCSNSPFQKSDQMITIYTVDYHITVSFLAQEPTSPLLLHCEGSEWRSYSLAT